MTTTDDEIARTLRTLTETRAPKTICPSEAARALAQNWRPLMPRIRAIAADMHDIEILQGGQPVDPGRARGPIRLRYRRGDPAGTGS